MTDRDGPLLLLHGFANTGGCWARLRRAGAPDPLEPRRRILAPDLRGHGAAAEVRPVDLPGVLGDLTGAVEAAGGHGWTLAGYSQGARLALHAALDPRLAPRLERLVLVSGSPGLADPAERAARRRADEALADWIEAHSIEAFSERWEQVPVLAGLDPGLAAEARSDRLANRPAGLAAALRGLGTGALAPLWDRLGELTLPVDLVVGARDAKFVAIAREMAPRLATAELTVVPDAGHQVHLQAPAALAAVFDRGPAGRA